MPQRFDPIPFSELIEGDRYILNLQRRNSKGKARFTKIGDLYCIRDGNEGKSWKRGPRGSTVVYFLRHNPAFVPPTTPKPAPQTTI